MKRLSKKYLRFLLIVAIVMLFISGCRRTESEEASTVTSQTEVNAGDQADNLDESSEDENEESDESKTTDAEQGNQSEDNLKSNFDLIGNYDGINLYYGPKDGYDKSVIVEENGEEDTLEGEFPSEPEMSPDGTRAAYIDMLEFELQGDVWLYDFAKDSNTKLTDVEDMNSKTCKEIEWLDDDHLLVIIGYAYGTVTQGGDVYLIDLSEDNPSPQLLYQANDYEEVIDLYEEDGTMMMTLIEWTSKDDLTTHEEVKELPDLNE